MIQEVRNYRDLKRFVYFVRELYQAEPHYVFPIFSMLKKELRKEVLTDKKYRAIMFVDGRKVLGRLLYTYEPHKQTQKTVCYFSFFDAIDDILVVEALFGYMEQDMLQNQVSYAEGTFSPYDPDTRRGILIKGFDVDPTLFTSYNYLYYQDLLEHCGYQKAYDTYSLKAEVSEESKRRLDTIANFVQRRLDVRVDSIDFKRLENDLEDVHQILEVATTDLNYQDPPSMDRIRKVAKNLKFFINPNLIVIARENQTNRPIGFCLVLPDYNQVLKKLKGRLNILKLLIERKKITKARGMMQYVIPEYQTSGLIGHLFKSVYDHFGELGIIEFEAGTMLEENLKPLSVFDKFGGKIIKTYRIYGKEVSL